jgi:RNA polymerase sigma factor (sigma-70 family)
MQKTVNQALTNDQRSIVLNHKKIASLESKRNLHLLPFGEESSSDIKQISYLAFCHAAQKYDIRYPFLPYARMWLRSYLRRFEGNSAKFHCSLNKISLCKKINITANRILTRKGPDKAANYVNWVIDRYDLFTYWSLFNSKRIDFEDIPSKKEELINQDFDFFGDLSEREELIIKKRFGFFGKEYTLEEISRDLFISRERVRQLESKAISKLKRKFYDER